ARAAQLDHLPLRPDVRPRDVVRRPRPGPFQAAATGSRSRAHAHLCPHERRRGGGQACVALQAGARLARCFCRQGRGGALGARCGRADGRQALGHAGPPYPSYDGVGRPQIRLHPAGGSGECSRSPRASSGPARRAAIGGVGRPP
ncbi:hypothetical protein EMIHUDRAFT_442216, partial [Emiliania huxleyi CCMP1516]|uniref:Uncharacterized protein n=2 Tax=Emiliania huxleyi TaxID=2903 RepID=A0A0D3K6S6_EMIH1